MLMNSLLNIVTAIIIGVHINSVVKCICSIVYAPIQNIHTNTNAKNASPNQTPINGLRD